MSCATGHPGCYGGFTLVELMVVVVIIGILTMIALPSYQDSIRRGKRGDAQAAMMEIANREQRYFFVKKSYANKTTLEASGYGLPTDVAANYSYGITISSPPPSFLITFTALGEQAVDGNLTLSSSGVKTPADKW